MGCTLAPSVHVMIPCRFLLGLAVGGASVTVPVYLAEVSPADRRGRMVTQNHLMIVTGQFLAYLCNAVLSVTLDHVGWLLKVTSTTRLNNIQIASAFDHIANCFLTDVKFF